MTLTTEIASMVDSRAAQFTRMADSIWDNPELRWSEVDSVQQHISLAEKYEFRITRNVADMPTAFYAEYGEHGPVIAILGEYDALSGLSQQSGVATPTADPFSTSGNGHGCGHHLLGAGSLLAAVTTAAYLKENDIPGRVRYYGCPAEEGGAAKTFMVKAGVFDDVDAAECWHPNTKLWTRQIPCMASSSVYFTFRGIATHAAVSPHAGRSALDALELMNVGVNFLREHMTDSCRIHYAITDSGGTSPNVVQDQATGYFFVRGANVPEMRDLYARVVKVAEGAALMTETTVEIKFEAGTADLLPNDVLEQALHGHAERLGGVPFDERDQATAQKFTDAAPADVLASDKRQGGIPEYDHRPLHDKVSPLNTMSRTLAPGSTDVGDVSWATPTVQIRVPCFALGSPFHSWLWVAQGKLPAAHKGMVYAAKVLAATAADLFAHPELLSRARAEFTATLDRNPYISPIPDDVLPPPACR